MMDTVDKLQAQATMSNLQCTEQRDFLVEFANQKTFDRTLEVSKVTMIQFLCWMEDGTDFKKEFQRIQKLKAVKAVLNAQSAYENSIEMLNEKIAKMSTAMDSLTPKMLEDYYADNLSMEDKERVERLIDNQPDLSDLTKAMASVNTMAIGYRKFLELNLSTDPNSKPNSAQAYLEG